VRAKNLIAHCGSAENVFREKISKLNRIPEIGHSLANAIHNADVLHAAEKEMAFITGNNVQAYSYAHHLYPYRLKQCPDAPLVLFTNGSMQLNNPYSLAIVGTRKATDYGKKFCADLVETLAPLKPLIVSGLAYGIDIAAHRAALQHQLPTVACLAHGLDRIYPAQHRSAAQQMVHNGGLVTEFISGTIPERDLFPSRNRIIAGLSDCVIVVETDLRGGSIITAHFASGYNRDVFAVPGRHNDPHSVGCNELIKKNIAAILCSPNDVAHYMQWGENTPATKVLDLFAELTKEEKNICEILKIHTCLDIDSLHRISQLPSSVLNTALLELEFKGVIAAKPGKIYRLR
jgi:DNA processing protein